MLKSRLLLATAAFLLSVSASTVFAQDAASTAQTPTQICENAGPAAEPSTRQFEQAEQVLQPGVDYRAVFCTDAGPIYIDLLEDLAPFTVNNFVFLAQNGYYNNTTFHRVIQDFMAQGGDPTATGTGGPGYQFADEFVGFLTFDQPGWLAMANAGPNTNGSQFFITVAAYPSLNYNYSIFGHVLEGQENVEGIRLRDPNTDTQPGTALNTVVIITDPASVTTTHQSPTPATQEQVSAAIDAIASELPEGLGTNSDVTGIKTVEAVVASIAEGLRESYSSLLSENNFQFRGAIEVDNTACSLSDAPFYSVGYTMDVFASRADASAFIQQAADETGVLYQAALADGYALLGTETTLPYPVFIGVQNVCDQDMTKARTFWQRGSFVITAEATFPANSQATADIWLQQLVGLQIYESLFVDVLRTTLN
ncbi:MAG: peptidylprolyl isomerase [Anaerolineae bacterium]